MSRKLVVFLVLLLTFQLGYGQEDDNVEIVTHKVALGETMLMISKKYLVTPTEIYRLNKKAIDGVSEGMILYIPQPIKSQEIITERKEKREKQKLALLERVKEREERELIKAKENEVVASVSEVEEAKDPNYGRREAISKLKISDKKQFIEHEVLSGETLNSLSKRYGVSVEEIEKENEKVLKKGLQAGSTLKMLVSQNLFINDEPEQVISTISTEDDNNNTTTEVMHKVNSGETLYSISKKYGISVNEISKANTATLQNGLQSGQMLKIKAKVPVVVNEDKNEKIIKTDLKTTEISNPDDITIIKHQVQPKETLYSISKKYNVSIEDIKQQNEELLTKSLQSGQEITIKVKK
ncbi:LysM peptidoglycan-binding domain-containing protein [uncultured Flavobacterium sp.]|uniref:LysM peptidoglycan-binding domain-containing protein n=1 Tax=uncultured Flavobacterium sp. TaxID=165435 RepID=UPI0030ED68E2